LCSGREKLKISLFYKPFQKSYKESLLPKVNVEDNMKKELKSFLKSQMEESQDKIGVSNITDLNYTTTSNSFSFINE